MTSPVSGDPFTWNVAGLLAESPGAERTYRVERAAIDLGDDLGLAEPVDARVHLVRTNRGILVDAELATALALECSRCLGDIAVPLEASIQEEYLPSLDIVSGRPLPTADEPDVPRLTDHHELSLEIPIREAILLAEPIAPLCRPDCPGLCIVCGDRLDAGAHDHPDEEIDPRLEALRGLMVDGG